ncbi:MAG: hypothetical protein A3C71_02070 [Candidatus Yanofskybacteria bacterium RIFCSPHIGHO2_02_FULL_43_15c]|uniref:Serine hydrolase family protein n=2 Tax=Candidatus Yanofskyibacteriota TaxID=1752733 RepID=A0A1F8H5A8_9BACT|nr:MAG: hypothetical protein A3C71_02070 [Candidatus Yanofskybacteria bacterium RIFCSPHIGHO2_02_FULL_43_15c]OGN32771.1 MAG: hypothetical protein A3I92_01510 [Candidatus Yanofskybacteria bacterium RIFCSPLOWO2_02_FULL_43_10b]
MKKVYIIHGWDGNPKEPMLQWLKINLEEEGYKVGVPLMPEPETPKIAAWVGKLKEIVVEPDENTILVGHSVGCQAVLRYLETLPEEIKVAGIVFIAPWLELDTETIKEEGEEVVEIAKPWIETPINFEKVRAHIGSTTVIFSDNDPFVSLSQKDLFEKELNAKIFVEHDKGHFDPASGISELPIALETIRNIKTS